MLRRRTTRTFSNPLGGKTSALGLLIDFSEPPGRIWAPPFVVGDHTRDILTLLGYGQREIDRLCASGAASDAADRAS